MDFSSDASFRYSVDVFQPPAVSVDSDDDPGSPLDGEPEVPPSECSSCTVTPSCNTDSTLTQTSETTEATESDSATSVSTSVEVIEEKLEETVGVAETSFIDVPAASTNSSSVGGLPQGATHSSSVDDCKDLRTEVGGDGLAEDKQQSYRATPPTRLVYGKQQDLAEGVVPPFMLKPCDREGRGITGPEGKRLEDHGDEPLQLTSRYLAMDWKNNEKSAFYVLVQSKELVYEEDSSMETAVTEENSDITLERCLSLFTEPEVLSPEHAWYCPQCKAHREASKQLSIWRLPHTLIIQLKRFSFRNFIWRDKIDTVVEFPLCGLDLSPYFIGSLPSSEPSPIYDLYGVVNHHGGLLGGHYTSYARCPDLHDWQRNEVGWRLFDDSMVSNTTERHVVTRAAYVLFYRRRNLNLDTNVASLSEGSSQSSSQRSTEGVGEEGSVQSLDLLPQDLPQDLPQAQLIDSDDYDDDDPSTPVLGVTAYMGPTPSPSGAYTDMESVD